MLGTGPIDDINSLMTLVEADFIILELPQNLDALTLRDPASGALTAGVGTSSNPFRQRLTVAHEIGHIVAGDVTEDGAALLCDTTHPPKRARTRSLDGCNAQWRHSALYPRLCPRKSSCRMSSSAFRSLREWQHSSSAMPDSFRRRLKKKSKATRLSGSPLNSVGKPTTITPLKFQSCPVLPRGS